MLAVMNGLILVCVSMGFVFVSGDSDSTNFFVDSYFDGATYYPYPLDRCLENGISVPLLGISADYVMYTCNDAGTEVTKTIYSDEDCSTVSSTQVFNESTIEPTGKYDFNCDGITSFATVSLCLSTLENFCAGCIGSSTLYTAVDTCAYGGTNNDSSYLSLMTTCDDTSVDITVFDGTLTCSNETNSTELQATSSCAVFTTIDTAYINAQMKACKIDFEPTLAPTAMPTGETSEPTAMPSGQPTEQPTEDDDDSAISILNKTLFSCVTTIVISCLALFIL